MNMAYLLPVQFTSFRYVFFSQPSNDVLDLFIPGYDLVSIFMATTGKTPERE